MCSESIKAFGAHFAILCTVLSLAVLIDYSIVPDDKKIIENKSLGECQFSVSVSETVLTLFCLGVKRFYEEKISIKYYLAR